MEKFNYTIKCADGVNAENANKLIKEILKYSSSIEILKDNKTANARIIFNVLGLNISKDDSIEFQLVGNEEVEESIKLKEYLNSNL